MTRRHHASIASRGVGLALMVLLTCATAASAAGPDGWRLRFYAARVDFDGARTTADDAGFTRFGLETGGGLGFNAEYRFSRRLGVDFGIFGGGGLDVEGATYCSTFCSGSSWVSVDTLAFSPLMAGLDVHLTPGHRADLYGGPLLAWIRYGDVAVQTGSGATLSRIEFDEQFSGGLLLGIGVPFGESQWTFDAQLIYLESALDGRGRDGFWVDRAFDTAIFGFGFGYRFSPWAGS